MLLEQQDAIKEFNRLVSQFQKGVDYGYRHIYQAGEGMPVTVDFYPRTEDGLTWQTAIDAHVSQIKAGNMSALVGYGTLMAMVTPPARLYAPAG